MSKIGIITIHNSPNYGACLQSYSLYQYLRSIDYDCEIIDLHRPTHPDYEESKKYTSARKKKKNPLKSFLQKFFCRKKKAAMSVIAQKKFDEFNSTIKLSQPYTSIDALYNDTPSYDVYIAGSDQLWNPTIGFCNEPYFLTFVKNGGKRLSYATSIGINDLREDEKRNYAKWLQPFAHISVRENSAKRLLESFMDKKIEQVADPSFLLDRAHWLSLAIMPQDKKAYILLFTLSFSSELLMMAQRLKAESGLDLYYLCLSQPQSDRSYIPITDAGPEEWLGYISNASMVITDSFHGTVFSVIMGARNFFTYVPTTKARGKRITDLLETFCLADHMFTEHDLSKSYAELEGMSIPCEKTTEIYLSEQLRSRNYLINAIVD